MMDITMFTTKNNGSILLVQIYVDDIVFGSGDLTLVEEFLSLMRSEFVRSLMGELTFFP